MIYFSALRFAFSWHGPCMVKVETQPFTARSGEMAIITISRDSYSHGKEIAESVARQLGYKCVGPEVIKTACEALDLEQDTVEEALRVAPSMFKRCGNSCERNVAMFRAAFFEYMTGDNIVYHGLAGHIFLNNVPNVLKVRVIADFQDRLAEEKLRTGDSEDVALRRLLKEDKKRLAWTKYLYGKDNHAPDLYDIYVNLHNISVEKAVRIIVDTAQISTNGYGPQMKKRLAELALQAKSEALLLEAFPEVSTEVRGGEVYARVSAALVQQEAVAAKARKVLEKEGIENAHVGVMASGFAPF
jgi:cytidylate kinase